MLDYKTNYLEEIKSLFTVKEIVQQPNTWLKTYDLIKEKKQTITKFLSQFTKSTKVYLAGAGTSEFIGNTIESYLNETSELNFKSISTTDIVLKPNQYFKKEDQILLVSYGRSGSSPESVATVELCNQLCDDAYHLIITCNKDGYLSTYSNDVSRYLVINLPEETHDKSFAMTSSYTNMMLASILTFNISYINFYKKAITDICEVSEDFLSDKFKVINDIISDFKFTNIQYLGTGALKYMSEEASLKMLELTAGQVNTSFNTALGFRHGPKSVINNNSLSVFFLSNKKYQRDYELDLIREMVKERRKNKILVVSNTGNHLNDIEADYSIKLDKSEIENDNLLIFPYVLIAQVIALKKAINLNISADNPCPSGEVNRVVKGVNIYKYSEENNE